MSEFKIGDRVEYVKHPGDGYMGAALGDTGTIKAIDNTGKNTWYAVEFDQKRDEYKNCNGHCKENKGYWCKAVSLKNYDDYNDDYAAETIVNQLKAEGYKAEDIANAVKNILDKKDDLHVGDTVEVVDTGRIYCFDSEKVIEMTADMGKSMFEILARFAYSYDPYSRGVDRLYAKYKIIAMDDKRVLLREQNCIGQVLLVNKDGVEKWTETD